MKTRMLTAARRLFASDLVPVTQNRENRRKWVRSVRALGDKWILASDETSRTLSTTTKKATQ